MIMQANFFHGGDLQSTCSLKVCEDDSLGHFCANVQFSTGRMIKKQGGKELMFLFVRKILLPWLLEGNGS